MMNRGVFGRQMFRYGGHVKMQDGGSVPQGPMPTDQGQMLDPEMAALAEGAMEQGVDPQMVQDELAGYAGQFEQMDQAEDYESAINAIRGDDLPIEDRYAELAELVGPEDAQSTPESVLTLVQPVIQMAEIDQGIGGLAAGQMEDVAVAGPMSQGIMSTVNLGADEEAAPPANFNQGGVVPPIQYYENGGAAGANPTEKYYNTPLGGPLALPPEVMPLTVLSENFNNRGRVDNSFSNSRENALFYDAVDSTINPEKQQISQPEKNEALTTYLGKNLQPRHSIEPVIELPEMDKEKEIEEEVDKRVKEKEADLKQDSKDATGLNDNLDKAKTVLDAAVDSGDEELKKYMKRYEDLLMDDESIKKNLKENKDMAKAQMLFGLAEGFFKFGSTPRKGGQSSLQVLMQSMAPAIQNASRQVAVLQAQKQKIEDRQMQIKLAALKSFDDKTYKTAVLQAKKSGDALANIEKFLKIKDTKQSQQGLQELRKSIPSTKISKEELRESASNLAKDLADKNVILRDQYSVYGVFGKFFRKFWNKLGPDTTKTALIKVISKAAKEDPDGQNISDEKLKTQYENDLTKTYTSMANSLKFIESDLRKTFSRIYKDGGGVAGKGENSLNAYLQQKIGGDKGLINLSQGDLKEMHTRINAIYDTLYKEREAYIENATNQLNAGDPKKVPETLSAIKMINRGLGNMSFLRRAIKPELVAKDSNQGNTETNKGMGDFYLKHGGLKGKGPLL
jgi:hypothetical protein